MDGFDRRLPIDLVQSEEGSEENKEAKRALSDEAGSETSLASIALHREAQLRRQRAAEAFAKAEAEAKAKAENERKAKARSDTAGNFLSLTSSGRQKTLSDAWWSQGNGSTCW